MAYLLKCSLTELPHFLVLKLQRENQRNKSSWFSKFQFRDLLQKDVTSPALSDAEADGILMDMLNNGFLKQQVAKDLSYVEYRLVRKGG